MNKRQTADEALAADLKAARQWRDYRKSWTATANEVVARHALNVDLGNYSDYPNPYDLDEQTRDRLLAHARQDAAHALVNTITLMTEVRRLRRLMLILAALCVLILLLSLGRIR